jgi:hypothetical protein
MLHSFQRSIEMFRNRLVWVFQNLFQRRGARGIGSAAGTKVILVSNAGETARTSRRTHNINWNATPERLFLKCVLGALIRKGLPKSELLAKFKVLVPSYQEFFDTPVSDSAIWGRADTGRDEDEPASDSEDDVPATGHGFITDQSNTESDIGRN